MYVQNKERWKYAFLPAEIADRRGNYRRQGGQMEKRETVIYRQNERKKENDRTEE